MNHRAGSMIDGRHGLTRIGKRALTRINADPAGAGRILNHRGAELTGQKAEKLRLLAQTRSAWSGRALSTAFISHRPRFNVHCRLQILLTQAELDSWCSGETRRLTQVPAAAGGLGEEAEVAEDLVWQPDTTSPASTAAALFPWA